MFVRVGLQNFAYFYKILDQPKIVISAQGCTQARDFDKFFMGGACI